MKNLLTLLERFSKVLNRETSTKEAIINVVKDKTRVTLSPEDFSLKEGVLRINSSSVAKNEIKFKEESIKQELREIHRLPISQIFYK